MSAWMFLVYGILVIGAISSFMNYRLQSKWYKRTYEEHKIDEINKEKD